MTFTPNLEEDLKRRDFTINAMAYNETEGLIDIFGGLKDIEAKLIRCVGNPEERFGEDALRIMRAIRFSAQLGYEIHEDTEAAIRKLAPTLQKISAERIQVELTKLLVSPHPDTLREAYDMGVTKVILPEFDAMMETPQKHKHHKYNVGEHTLHALMEIGPDKNLRYAMLLHDIGKPATLTVDEDGITHFYGHPAVGEEMARKILRRLRFDNDTVAVVTRLVRYHDYGNDVIPDLRIVRRAQFLFFPLQFAGRYFPTVVPGETGRYSGTERLPENRKTGESRTLEETVSGNAGKEAVRLPENTGGHRQGSDRHRYETGQRAGRDAATAAGTGIGTSRAEYQRTAAGKGKGTVGRQRLSILYRLSS